jgi:hypothetical protein
MPLLPPRENATVILARSAGRDKAYDVRDFVVAIFVEQSERKLTLHPLLSCWESRETRENLSMRTVSPLHAGQQAAQADDVRSVHLPASKAST